MPRGSRAGGSPSSYDLRDELGCRRAIADAFLAARFALGWILLRREPAERGADPRGVLVVDLELDRLLVAKREGFDRLVLDADDDLVELFGVRLVQLLRHVRGRRLGRLDE